MEASIPTVSIHDTCAAAAIVALPSDVLKTIFEVAFAHSWGNSEYPGAPCADDTTGAITATHVSRRWRQVASSLPNLWACIHVHVNPSLNLLTLYLDNSGSLPLSIVGSHDVSQAALTSRHTPCMELLLNRAADRIQHADVSSDDARHFLAPLLWKIKKHSFPSLIHLSLTNWAPEDDLDATCRLHLAAPQLNYLHVMSIAVAFDSSTFENLRSLDICYCRLAIPDLDALSTATPQLAVLTLEDCYLGIVGPANTVAHLPQSLHTLHIRHDTIPADVILSRIAAPGLECLEIDAAVAYEGPAHGRTDPPRTFPSARRLIIHMARSSTNPDTYDGYHFSLAPAATSFHVIDIYGVCGPLVTCLASHPTYLPDLRRLTVDVKFVPRVEFLREPLTVLVKNCRDTLEKIGLSPNLFDDLGGAWLEDIRGEKVEISFI